MKAEKLPEDVISRIRSSASVYSVAQCVNELVLNSLDAKSKNIAVRINLATFRIQVVDDGDGILEGNLCWIGEHYMSSKCQTLKEFESISKYHGFKGESLASITEHAEHVTLATKHSSSEITYSKKIGVGESVHVIKNRPSQGTTITVENFLYNLPVRRNVVNGDLEFALIKSNLEMLDVMHPSVCFSLKNDVDKVMVFASSRSESVEAGLLKIHSILKSDNFGALKLKSGVMSMIGLIYKDFIDLKAQHIYVNKRPVVCNGLFRLVNDELMCSKIYRKDKKKGKFCYLLNLKCSNADVTFVHHEGSVFAEFRDWDGVVKFVQKFIWKFLKKEKLDVEQKEAVAKKMKTPSFRLSGMGGACKGMVTRKKCEDVVNMTVADRTCVVSLFEIEPRTDCNKSSASAFNHNNKPHLLNIPNECNKANDTIHQYNYNESTRRKLANIAKVPSLKSDDRKTQYNMKSKQIAKAKPNDIGIKPSRRNPLLGNTFKQMTFINNRHLSLATVAKHRELAKQLIISASNIEKNVFEKLFSCRSFNGKDSAHQEKHLHSSFINTKENEGEDNIVVTSRMLSFKANEDILSKRPRFESNDISPQEQLDIRNVRSKQLLPNSHLYGSEDVCSKIDYFERRGVEFKSKVNKFKKPRMNNPISRNQRTSFFKKPVRDSLNHRVNAEANNQELGKALIMDKFLKSVRRKNSQCEDKMTSTSFSIKISSERISKGKNKHSMTMSYTQTINVMKENCFNNVHSSELCEKFDDEFQFIEQFPAGFTKPILKKLNSRYGMIISDFDQNIEDEKEDNFVYGKFNLKRQFNNEQRDYGILNNGFPASGNRDLINEFRNLNRIQDIADDLKFSRGHLQCNSNIIRQNLDPSNGDGNYTFVKYQSGVINIDYRDDLTGDCLNKNMHERRNCNFHLNARQLGLQNAENIITQNRKNDINTEFQFKEAFAGTQSDPETKAIDENKHTFVKQRFNQIGPNKDKRRTEEAILSDVYKHKPEAGNGYIHLNQYNSQKLAKKDQNTLFGGNHRDVYNQTKSKILEFTQMCNKGVVLNENKYYTDDTCMKYTNFPELLNNKGFVEQNVINLKNTEDFRDGVFIARNKYNRDAFNKTLIGHNFTQIFPNNRFICNNDTIFNMECPNFATNAQTMKDYKTKAIQNWLNDDNFKYARGRKEAIKKRSNKMIRENTIPNKNKGKLNAANIKHFNEMNGKSATIHRAKLAEFRNEIFGNIKKENVIDVKISTKNRYRLNYERKKIFAEQFRNTDSANWQLEGVHLSKRNSKDLQYLRKQNQRRISDKNVSDTLKRFAVSSNGNEDNFPCKDSPKKRKTDKKEMRQKRNNKVQHCHENIAKSTSKLPKYVDLASRNNPISEMYPIEKQGFFLKHSRNREDVNLFSSVEPHKLEMDNVVYSLKSMKDLNIENLNNSKSIDNSMKRHAEKDCIKSRNYDSNKKIDTESKEDKQIKINGKTMKMKASVKTKESLNKNSKKPTISNLNDNLINKTHFRIDQTENKVEDNLRKRNSNVKIKIPSTNKLKEHTNAIKHDDSKVNSKILSTDKLKEHTNLTTNCLYESKRNEYLHIRNEDINTELNDHIQIKKRKVDNTKRKISVLSNVILNRSKRKSNNNNNICLKEKNVDEKNCKNDIDEHKINHENKTGIQEKCNNRNDINTQNGSQIISEVEQLFTSKHKSHLSNTKQMDSKRNRKSHNFEYGNKIINRERSGKIEMKLQHSQCEITINNLEHSGEIKSQNSQHETKINNPEHSAKCEVNSQFEIKISNREDSGKIDFNEQKSSNQKRSDSFTIDNLKSANVSFEPNYETSPILFNSQSNINSFKVPTSMFNFASSESNNKDLSTQNIEFNISINAQERFPTLQSERTTDFNCSFLTREHIKKREMYEKNTFSIDFGETQNETSHPFKRNSNELNSDKRRETDYSPNAKIKKNETSELQNSIDHNLQLNKEEISKTVKTDLNKMTNEEINKRHVVANVTDLTINKMCIEDYNTLGEESKYFKTSLDINCNANTELINNNVTFSNNECCIMQSNEETERILKRSPITIKAPLESNSNEELIISLSQTEKHTLLLNEYKSTNKSSATLTIEKDEQSGKYFNNISKCAHEECPAENNNVCKENNIKTCKGSEMGFTQDQHIDFILDEAIREMSMIGDTANNIQDYSNEEKKLADAPEIDLKSDTLNYQNGAAMPADFKDSIFGMVERSEFVPKGLSPILMAAQPSCVSMTSSGKIKLYSALAESYKEELGFIKWKNIIVQKEPRKFFDEIYKYLPKTLSVPIISLRDNQVILKKSSHFVGDVTFTRDIFDQIKVIGQLDKKFIVTATRAFTLILFDQHSVHERIRLEQLYSEYAINEADGDTFKLKCKPLRQHLEIGDMNDAIIILEKFNTYFNKFGMKYTITKNGILVTAVPLCLYNKSKRDNTPDKLKELVKDLIDDLVNMVKDTKGCSKAMPKVIQNVVNSEACRGAVMFGDFLTTAKCTEFIQQLKKCNFPFQCAHGRPTIAPIMNMIVDESKIKPVNLKRLRLIESVLE